MDRDKLIDFVKEKHGRQVRKYTGEPYFNHLIAVGTMAVDKCSYGFEIGLCHDVLEDTECNEFELVNALINFGYDPEISRYIVNCVIDLTDVYTSERSPELNRKTRKHLEAMRLHNIRPEAQTVKYCDLINNTESIVRYDKGFAQKYLAEKREILKGMDQGNPEMYSKCLETLQKAETELAKSHLANDDIYRTLS